MHRHTSEWWDAEGKQHKLRVYTHANLTKNFNRGKLQEKDLQFIRKKGIKLSLPQEGSIKPPEVLIGCDQLWSFIKFDAPHFTLPSGLHLVPTRFGYMVSGQRIGQDRKCEQQLNTSVHVVESFEDHDPWERHWNTLSREVEKEYCGPEKEEKARINAQVLEKFNSSIEKRSNGYVVRLPFKEEYQHLPDNRTMALYRLRSVLRKYETKPSILQQYNDVFQDQLAKNILEEVNEEQETFGKRRHYLPHQPVITPQKDTTKFRVVAFVSNGSEIMDAVSALDRSANLSPKVLGIPWDSAADNFSLSIKVCMDKFVSKRTIAQQIASIYDPFGWFIPLLVKAKHFQQFLWKESYDWDEPLTEEHRQEWYSIVGDMTGFHKTVARKVTQDSAATYSLITFSDASGIAMTACTYLTSENDSSFLMAKSKVADIRRPATVPKMEMNAMTIGARLTLNTFLSLKSSVAIKKIIFLTDSEIVLNWLQSFSSRLKTGPYVKNRVREVHNIVVTLKEMELDVQFGYIDTKWNIADIGTRGASSKDLSTHAWWTGYTLNSILHDGFAKTFFHLKEEKEEEDDDAYCPSTVDVNAVTKYDDRIEDILDLARCRNLTKTLRILAYVIRFMRNIIRHLQSPFRSKLANSCFNRPSQERTLVASDIREAHNMLIRNHQIVHLRPQYRKELSKNLNLKEDEEHLLRTYGRLNKSDLHPMARNPILIAPNTELSRLIVQDAHGLYHRGTAHTMAEVRQQYWIPRLREQVKKCIRSCVQCQKMNNLPYR
ncbi:Pao retrotransposon peptidase [Ancylostoma duodenale]|uniref:Pao retrotransposon peptidase n=1 Tax=Ancylostoma duodenale TaxID=51022 RepID=A0A0C2D1I7_9BILA|nr:Pao retrotransposon peptidase [Ancylostoma duodenale]